MKKTEPQIEQVATASLVPYARNAKKHDAAQVAAIAGSIREFGFNNPVLIDADNGIIAGHGRTLAAHQLGLATVPCLRLTHLTDSQRRAYILADNRLAEIGGGWDSDMLAAELEALAADGVAMEDLGFDADALEELGASFEEETNPDADAEPQIDKAEELRAKWGVEPGQLWELGDHRLLCGDSTKKEDVERVIGGAKASALLSDPPYGIGYEYRDHDDSNNEANAELVEKAFAGGPSCKIWTPGLPNLARDIVRFGKAKVIVWFKKFAAAGNGIGGASVWEPVLVVGKPPAQELKSDVIECMTDRAEVAATSLRELHSCPKPVALYAQLLKSLTAAGHIIYEPFSGSGTTIIACEQLGRKCRAIEISPAYVAVAIQRWADATGKEPKRLA
jgi:ParB-like chromosome segregation protein Spo0J